MIVMPDADMDQAADALIGSGYGSAGERCMAIAVAVPVGEQAADALIEKLVPKVEALKIGPSNDPDADFGPLVTGEALTKVAAMSISAWKRAPSWSSTAAISRCRATRRASSWAAACSTGSSPTCASTRRRSSARCSRSSAPAITRKAWPAIDHEYGNGVAVFTRDGDAARDFASRVNVGMVGINVPIPVPLAYSHLRRLEALRFRRPQPARPGFDPLLHQDQDGHLALALGGQGGRLLRHPDDVLIAPAAPGHDAMAGPDGAGRSH